MDVQPLDTEKLQKLPGIVGYIVQPGDSLWKIAKKFHTTVDNIMDTNGLTSDLLQPCLLYTSGGDRREGEDGRPAGGI